MKLETFSYRANFGWSRPDFPEMDSEKTAIIVFGSTSFAENPGKIDALVKAYPNSKILGCSTAGEIFNTEVFDESLSIAVMQFEHTTLKLAQAQTGAGQESFEAGRLLAAELNSPELRGVFIISNGLKVNGTELLRGIKSILDKSVVVTGGLAGDGKRFEKTWVLSKEGFTSDVVMALGFYGNAIQISHGSKGGWDLFGPERLVTRSKANILYDIDRTPALKLYKEYLGERASGLPSTGLLFPLALRSHKDDSKTLVRTILAVDEVHQSITFAGDIPEGSYVQLMRANFDRLIDGAAQAGEMTSVGVNNTGGPTLALAISCVGRRLVLGERTEEEIEATKENLPAGTSLIGFYSYGEISPYVSGESCDLHNQTMTVTTFCEST
ncbi:MAG: hypothetical protein RJB38_1399 [Pseudomonadota bacterium]|jgi:hypothetical protein